MPEAWEIIPTTERTFDEITTFILFCEDKVNEPTYFQALQKEKKVKINFVEDVKSDHLNFLNTIDYCIKKDLMELVGANYKLRADVTEHIWCVYDRDSEKNDPTQLSQIDQLRFTTAIASAEAANLKVAWSNDVFELWILLHFEDVPPGVCQHRIYVYDRLTEIFKNLPEQTPELLALTTNPYFNYKLTMKKRTNFIKFVRPLLASRQDLAFERAAALEAIFPVGTPYHNCNPCTKIHHLVQSILSFH